MLLNILRKSLVPVFILAAIAAFGQPTKPDRRDLDQTIDLPLQFKERLLFLVDSAFGAYADACSFKDTKTGVPSEESIRRFRSLFEAGSFHVRDFGEGLNSGTASKYISDAVALYPLGLKGYITYSAYHKLGYDSAGVYVIQVRFKKLFYEGVDKDGNKKGFKPAREVPLVVTYYVEKDLPDRALIYKVEYWKEPIKMDVELFAGIRYGSATPNFKMTQHWQDNTGGKTTAAVSFKKIPIQQFGFGFRLTPKPKKPFSISGEVFFGSYAIAVSGEGFKHNLRDTTTTEIASVKITRNWRKEVSVTNWEEMVSLKTVEIALGAGYRLLERERLSFYADGQICFSLNQTKGEADFSAQNVYVKLYEIDKKMDEHELTAPNNTYIWGPANADNKPYAKSNPSPETSASLAIRLRPLLVFNLTETIGLRVGADYTHGFKPLFKVPDSEAAAFSNDVKKLTSLSESVLASQVASFKTKQVALHAGLSFKIK